MAHRTSAKLCRLTRRFAEARQQIVEGGSVVSPSSLKTRRRTIFMCLALELGVLSGVPMRPEEIRSLMHQINQPKQAHVLPVDESNQIRDWRDESVN